MPRKRDSKKRKAERCVRKVKKQSPRVNPFAVCRSSTGFKGKFGRSRRRSVTKKHHKR